MHANEKLFRLGFSLKKKKIARTEKNEKNINESNIERKNINNQYHDGDPHHTQSRY